MRILALESSAKAASVCLWEDGKLTAQYFQNSGLTHSRTLLKMTEDLLKNLECSLSEVDMIAVAKGPGSFTGIRIGVAAAKGLAWAGEKRIAGVSTLEAMAHQVPFCDGILCPVMDARRSQVYNAKFRMRDGVLTRICEDRAISVEELFSEIRSDTETYIFVGDGAEMCYNIALREDLNVRLAPDPVKIQTAWGVAKAAEYVEAELPDDLAPNYLRLSQAERERLAKEKNQEG